MKRPKIGLALGGGVVRGFSHIGVLYALEEAGIPIDVVTGASVGSIMGYGLAAGLKAAHLEQMAEGLGWFSFARPVLPQKGFVSFDRLRDWLVNTFGDLYFEDLALPFAVMTTDMETGEPFPLHHGPVAPVVQASCSVPGFVEPVRLHGRLLADGGIANNLPMQAARELGADYVIGVDIFQHEYHRHLGPLAAGLAAVEIMVQHSGRGIAERECIIRPKLQNVTYFNFNERQKLIDLGREATLASLPEIHSELAQLAEQH